MKEHSKDSEPEVFQINKNQNYIIFAPSNDHCFNKIMKDWPEDIIKKDQLEVFKKINCGLHPENIHRLVRKNGNPTTLVLFKLKNEGKKQYAKRMCK